MAKFLINCTHGPEDPERATLSFIVGNLAAASDQEAVVLLTIDGVWLGKRGAAEGVQKDGFPALKDVMGQFVSNGGQIWLCGTCTKPRGIIEADLIEGARIVTAAFVVQHLAQGGVNTMDY
jgi:predicted peroxiredoxin